MREKQRYVAHSRYVLSDAVLAKLDRLYADGMSASEAAAVLGIKRATAEASLKRRGLMRPRGNQRGGLAGRFLAQISPEPNSGCWLWLGKLKDNGYGVLRDGQKDIYAHRASVLLSGRTIPAGHHVCHRCDNPACVNPDHLFVAEPIINVRDKQAKGRQLKGASVGNSKLSEQNARAVIAALMAGDSQSDIAARFGLSSASVSRIATGQSWRHLDRPNMRQRGAAGESALPPVAGSQAGMSR